MTDAGDSGDFIPYNDTSVLNRPNKTADDGDVSLVITNRCVTSSIQFQPTTKSCFTR